MIKLLTFLLRFSPRLVGLVIVTGLLAGMSSAGLIALINISLSANGPRGASLVAAFVALGLTMMISGFISRALLIELSQNAVFELRMRLARQILAAPLIVLEKFGAPRLLASLIDDVMVVTGALLGIPALFINLATIIVCLVYLGWLSWQVLLAVLLFMALGMVSYHTLLKKALYYLQQARQQQNKLFGDFRALTQGAKELKLHLQRREDFLENRLRTTGATSRRFNIIGARIYAGADSWGQFLFFVFIGLTLFALPVMHDVPAHTIVGYILALLFMMAPIEVLLNFIPNIGRARIALQQIESLGLSLDKATADNREERGQPAPNISWQRLDLVNVTHTYHQENSDESFTLGPINATLEAGETVFLIGGNGSGKTTLVKLITGLYVPEEGELQLDGQPITGANREWYRGHFSAVFSDFFLFETLLGMASDGVDDIAAHYLSKLHLDHKVKVTNGELSTIELSQGQRKRLALLTALMEDRVLYVFDEWAADQDPVFKKVFYTEFLPTLKARGKTVLVITHDDSYYALADRLIKLENGHVVPLALPVPEGVAAELIAARSEKSFITPAADGRSRLLPAQTSVDGNGTRDLRIKQQTIVTDSTEEKTSERVAVSWPWPNLARSGATILFVAIVVLIALSLLRPPAAVPESAPATEFSSARALKHLSVIASKPHPVGTLEQAQTRDYILEELRRLGLSPEVHAVSVVDNIRGELLAGTAQNIVARMPGTDSHKAVALVAHYDSTPYGPGASDDGAAVAAILETVRALKTGLPLKNDLIFLFTDGEEELMLGARAFRAEDPLLKDIALVLNFEARGTSGPSIMFETSPNNGWLIKQYAAAASYPVANSLSYEIYRLMPNATDFTIFKEAGISGLNFAYIAGAKNYHTALDNLENLDQRSLQHHGVNALALARHFGNASLDSMQAPNAVYFNTPGTGFVSYSASWLIPLLLLNALVLAGVLIVGLRKAAWTVSDLLIGTAGMLFSVVLVPGVVWLVWYLLSLVQTQLGTTAEMALYKSGYFGAAWISLSVAIFAALYNVLGWKVRPLGLAVSGLGIWLLLSAVTVIVVPGGNYLLAWPLLFALLGMMVLLFLRHDARLDSWRAWLISCIFALPSLLLFVPLIKLIHIALGNSSFLGLAILSMLLGLGLLPLFYFVTSAVKWSLPLVAVAVAVICLFIGVLPSGHNREHPKPFHLLYALNADTRKAVWASVDTQPNEWTEQFLSAQPQRGPITEYVPSNYKSFLQQPAEPIEASAPNLTMLDDQTAGGVRTLRLRVSSSRQAAVTYVVADPGTRILTASLAGRQIDFNDQSVSNEPLFRKLLTYHGIPNEGIELTLQTKPGAPVKLICMDQTYGLPAPTRQDTTRAKPDYLIPMSFTYSNATLVQKPFTF